VISSLILENPLPDCGNFHRLRPGYVDDFVEVEVRKIDHSMDFGKMSIIGK
jgi:hypothetical protein